MASIDGVAVDRRIAVAELAGVLDFDRHAGEFLEQVFADQPRVVARAAGGHDDAVDLAQLLRREVQAAEVGGGVVVVEPAAHRVGERLGLLVNLLEHVVREVALVRVAVAEEMRDVVDRHIDTVSKSWSRMTSLRSSSWQICRSFEVDDLVRVARRGRWRRRRGNVPSSPMPMTSGLPRRAPTITPGS